MVLNFLHISFISPSILTFLFDFFIYDRIIMQSHLQLLGKKLHFSLYFQTFGSLTIRYSKMGCEQSDVMPFVNALGDDQDRNQHRKPQQVQPQQPAYQQAQYQPQPVYQQQQQQPYYQQPTTQQYQQPATQQYQQPVTLQYQQYPPQTAAHQQPMPVAANSGQKQPEIKVEAAPRAKKPRKTLTLPQRQFLNFDVDLNEDFLAHHLSYELTLSKLTSMKRIRRRQILEHLYLQALWGIGGLRDLDISYGAYQESLVSAWTQRTFLEIWEQGHDDLFVKHLEEKEVRRKISEQFMFELFELKEYVDSGMAFMHFAVDKSQIELFSFVQTSDDALFNIFKKLKDRYPQTGTTEKIEFPDVPSTKTDMDLLNNFNKLSFSDPANMNYQTIYEDINFLLKRAAEEKDTFKADMRDILGDDVLACPKVGEVDQDGKISFNACAVRRVVVKWAENLLQKCPDLISTKAFMRFIRARAEIVNNFVFKSTIRPTTHKIVIDCISLLLQVAKYNLTDKKKRDEFIFNIYDLLRCKIKRKTPTEIVNLLKKMQSTSVTKNGKKFEVIRVKNRFKTSNRDLLINFRYGDVLVGEAQLCIDSANVAKETKLNYQFCHYIYQLERSLFGPTLELMMQYEDFQRPDIIVSFEAEDIVLPRGNQTLKNAAQTKRKCLQGHDMITMVGNFFFPPKTKQQTEEETINTEYQAVCNYCDRQTTTSVPYDYCYICGCFLCGKCREQYKKVDNKTLWLSVQRQELLPAVNSVGQMQNLCKQNKSIIVLIWLQGSSASSLLKDAIIYQQSKSLMQPGKYIPKIYQAKYANSPAFKEICNKYKVAQYPTLLLLNDKAQALRTVFGFSWYQVPVLYMSQKRLLQGKDLDLDIYCIGGCQGKMQATAMMQGKNCLNCFGASKPVNMPSQLENIGAYCQNGHYRCINCVYSAINCPTSFRDGLGTLYLSSKFANPSLPKCPKGHQTTITKATPSQSWTFECFKCNSNRFYDNEHGTGECKQCKSYVCSRCLGANLPSFKEMKEITNIVCHYVESTAEQASLCFCQRNFKKVYSGRVGSLEQINQEDHDQNLKWTCDFCQKRGQPTELHLACFSCPFMSQHAGKKADLHICMNCAAMSKLLLAQPQKKVEQLLTLFHCPKDNSPIFFTSVDYNKKLVVNCVYCKRNYFANTQRLHCKACGLNCCKDCRQTLINKGKAPVSYHKCIQGHNLVFRFLKNKEVVLCNGCRVVIRNELFSCDKDEYLLCTTCVMTKSPNFVGSGKSIKELQEQQQLLQYYKHPQLQDHENIFKGYKKGQEDQEVSSDESMDDYSYG